MTNIAIENGPFILDLPIKHTHIYILYYIATLVYQRVTPLAMSIFTNGDPQFSKSLLVNFWITATQDGSKKKRDQNMTKNIGFLGVTPRTVLQDDSP